MRKEHSLIVTLVCLLLLGAIPAQSADVGTVFGTLWSARPIGAQAGEFGLNVGIADATSVYGTFTYGVGEHWDGRLKLGLIDDENMDPKLGFGIDLKNTFLDAGGPSNHPMDMAAGGFLEWYDTDPLTVMQFGAVFLGSRDFMLKNNQIITPYAQLSLRLERVSWEFMGEDNSDSDLEFGFNVGVKYQMTRYINLYGEFQLDGNDGLFVGLTYLIL
ncbi:hypothetical protein GF356_10105 [candidate division GN15 bacterium]|nr:hypothetical protein [candidate division GN15 bacterium]